MRRGFVRPVVVPLLLALGAAGCLRDAEPFSLSDDAHSIHAILEAGSDRVAVLVTRSLSAGGATVVTDADVRLIVGEDTVFLANDRVRTCIERSPEWPAGRCYRSGLPSPVSPGAAYHLEVRFADGSRATGRTVVPPPAELTEPAEGAVLTARCGDLLSCYGPESGTEALEATSRWTAPAEAAGADIVLQPTRVYLDEDEYAGATCGPASGYPGHRTGDDSAIWRISIDCAPPLSPARFDSIRADLVLTTRNGHYQRYLDATEDGETIRGAAASGGLDGAWGIFGATTTVRRTVVIVRDTTSAEQNAIDAVQERNRPGPRRSSASSSAGSFSHRGAVPVRWSPGADTRSIQARTATRFQTPSGRRYSRTSAPAAPFV